MKIKGVSKDKLKLFIEKNYPLIIKKIKYFPLGEDGASYILNCKNDNFFVKVYQKEKKSHTPTPVNEIMDFLLKTHINKQYNQSPLPILNLDKKPLSYFNEFPVVLYEYIQGGHMKTLSSRDFKELGKLIADLHNIPIHKFPKIRMEKLDLKFEHEILNILKEIKANTYRKNSIKNKMKNLLLSEEKNLVRGLEFLKENVAHIINKCKNGVFAHTDLHNGNMMKIKDKIYLIDWDSLCIALPEKDLIWFGDVKKVKKVFEKTYSQHLKKRYKFDKIAYKYYVIKRILSTRTFFARNILYENNSKEQEKNYINWMENGMAKLQDVLKE